MTRLAMAIVALGWIACAHKPVTPASERHDLKAPRCIEARGSGPALADTWVDGQERATVTATGEPCRHTFSLKTTATLRDGVPENPRTFSEEPGQPTLSTRNPLFDALYALAHAEVRAASVDSIRDGAFFDGKPVACDCFETGRLWTYVWTRDTSYAIDLALAAIDPARAKNSLLYKISERRGGGDVQIVQDTGSGGSYPISTDRVVWALGAEELLKYLSGPARTAFLATAFEAMRNTVEHDRAVVYDPHDGLYRGETSFLDWREQTYPSWTAKDTLPIGTAKALSTNIAHLRILEITAQLARERGETDLADRYASWARSLSDAIRARFYLEQQGQFSSFILTPLDPAPSHRYDLLGTALAVLSGVATGAQAKEVVARYPHLPRGAPVIWPQQPDVPIYHNRAIWPFVTAYWLRAAKAVRNDAAVTLGVQSLVRGAALNLSNMENFEAATGAAQLDDGALSGPVVNSQRQLWSVAGYLSMVQDVLFGLEASQSGIRFVPYITRALRHDLFASADTLVLNNFPYRGKTITVVLELPPKTGDRAGAYQVGAIKLNGERISQDFFAAGALEERNLLTIELVDTPEASATITRVEDLSDPQTLFSPPAPAITGVTAQQGGLRVDFAIEDARAEAIAFNLYRDGALVKAALPSDARSWLDREAEPGAGHCYTAEAYFLASQNASHRARPVCDGKTHREPFTAGKPTTIRPPRTGDYWLRLVYRNANGPINTGITCAIKHLTVRDAATGEVIAEGFVAMPHLGKDNPDRQGRSSFVRVSLEAGKRYEVAIKSDPRAVNMSAFAHFSRYTGGAGGASGELNEATIDAVELSPIAKTR